MDLVTGPLGTLPSKLLELLKDEYNLQKGVKKQVEGLSQELESMYAAMNKVAAVPWDQLDDEVKIWARHVREASYDVEDILDTFLVRVKVHEPADDSGLKHALKKIGDVFTKGKARHDISRAIEDIMKKLQEVADRRARYKLDDFLAKPVAMTSAVDPRLVAMHREASQLIGMDKSMSDIISLVRPDIDDMPGKKIMNKVSIFGVGGLGKTTVAKASYDKLKSQYNCAAFVSVGRNPNFSKVFMDILFKLDEDKYKSIHSTGRSEDLLIDEIRDYLKNKRYFIVIDDIWEPNSWEIIRLAFDENRFGCGIITTTRKLEVATRAGTIYKLQPLSHHDSKKLLYTRVFQDKQKCLDDEPDEVSDKILKKCDGIPLSIITMASLLVGKPMVLWSELYTAIGFNIKDNMQVQNTTKIISFSYYDMPSHLRTCLLYLSTFPEDHVIDKNPLIWKWIAEGFIHSNEQETCGLFELGERYFNDLINRSLIQVEHRYDGEVTGCRVHDMVLDLIRSLSQEENFVTILGNGGGTSAQYKTKVRRLANQKGTVEHISPECDEMDTKHVRSYIASLQYSTIIIQQSYLLSFKFLRVLAMEHCTFTKDCNFKNIGNLIHLRYLSLRRTNVSKFPEQIGNLKLLQTLDLDRTMIKDLHASIVQLRQLVCLSCSHWYTKEIPVGIGKMTSLEQLKIDVDSKAEKFMKELGSLRQLRTLEISFWVTSVEVDDLGAFKVSSGNRPEAMDKSIQRYLVDSLSKLKKIQHLKVGPIEGADVDTWEAEGFALPQQLRHLSWSHTKFPRLPSFVNLSLHHLSYLEICVVTLVEQDLNLLGRLKELRCLSLGTEVTVTVSEINAGDAFFPELRYFNMWDAMVQIEHKNEDSSFSLHIWNGMDPAPFGSRINGDGCRCKVDSAIMPKLEKLSTSVHVRALKDGSYDISSIIGLDYLASLREVLVDMECKDASDAEVNKAKTALRDAIRAHPNHPICNLFIHKYEAGVWSTEIEELVGRW